jgi:hypothetical protein
MKISTRFAATALTACLGLGGIAGPASASSERLPREDFPACNVSRMTYCIESVTFMEPGANIAGTWVDKAGTVVDGYGTPVTDVFTTSTAFPGRWSYQGFPVTTRGYDGVYIKVGPANQYTDIMSISVEPAGKKSATEVGRVITTNPTTLEQAVQSLSLDSGVSVKVRLGPLTPGVTVAVADDAKINKSMSGKTPVLDFSGYPVTVPLHKRTSDCESEEGSSYAEVNQLLAVVAFTSGRDPFGVAGLSGDMLISSNGVCQLSTPVWDAGALEMNFTTAAPHFSSTGEENRGFYRAFIPATDAAILYGITDPTVAKSDLKLEIDSDIYGTKIAARAVSGSKKGIIISYTGFKFSAPTLSLKAKNKAKFKKLKKQKTKAVVKKAIAKNKKNRK